jgi:hypothetical protein
VKQDIPLDLADISLLGPHPVVSHPDGFSDLIEELRPVPLERARYADNMLN